MKVIPILTTCLSLAAIGSLAGCNTAQGLGRDTQALGRGIERTAKKAPTPPKPPKPPLP